MKKIIDTTVLALEHMRASQYINSWVRCRSIPMGHTPDHHQLFCSNVSIQFDE